MPNATPTVDELLTSVSKFLSDELAPTLTGAQTFHTRVAINLLKTAEREVLLGSINSEEEKQRLQKLLNSDATLEQLNISLLDKIRKKQLGLDDKDLVGHLFKTTMAQLAIDNPRYSTYLALKGSTGERS